MKKINHSKIFVFNGLDIKSTDVTRSRKGTRRNSNELSSEYELDNRDKVWTLSSEEGEPSEDQSSSYDCQWNYY